MPATFKVGQKVQNSRQDSQYYGQIGVIEAIQPTHSSKVRHVVLWPNGDKHVYYAESLSEALIPEKNFQSSDTGFRNGKRKIVHTVPASNRPVLV